MYDCTVVQEQDDSFTSQTRITAHDNLATSEPEAIDGLHEPLAIPGPGPSTLAARERQLSSGPMEEVNGRHWAHMQSSTTTSSSRPHTRNLTATASFPHSIRPSRPVSMDFDDLWELEDLVGESGTDEYDGPPDESVRQQRRLKRLRDDTVEITDELTESTIITQTLERVHEDGRRWSSPWHAPRRSRTLPDVTVEVAEEEEPGIRMETTVNTPRRRSTSSLSSKGDENDWIEVDQLLEPDERDDEGVEIPSAPNGSTSVGTMSYRDALEHPLASSERIQLVLKTMTNKLLQRKKTVRRVRADSPSGASSREGTIERSGSETALETPRPDVRRIEWSEESPSRSAMTSSTSSYAPSASTHTSDSGQTPTKGMSRLFSSKQKTPPSAFDGQTAIPAMKVSSMGHAFSRARSAFRSSSRRPSRTASPESSTATSTRPPFPSQDSTCQTASPISTPSSEAPNAVPQGVKPPLPTPYVSMLFGRPEFRDNRAPPRTDRSSNGHDQRPSINAVHESVRTSRTRIQAGESEAVSDTPATLFPHDSLIKNIHRFMRYSSAAYGQNFLRIMGLGNSEYNFPNTMRHHANSWAFVQHTNIPIDALLLSSYADSTPAFTQQKAPPLVHYIAVEHKLQAIVLTCRGTLGLSDVLIDLTCEYRTISVDGGSPGADYYVHAGMYQSALGLTAKNSTVHQTLMDALNKYPTYGLVFCGHSLGGGVAALLAIASSTPSATFLKQTIGRTKPMAHPPISTPFVTSFASGLPAGRPIHCYAYGPPAVTSPDLARYTQGLITSVVQNSDVVPCLSLGTLRDLKNVAVTLFEEGNVAEEIVGRVSTR